jgi:hypothetical protein
MATLRKRVIPNRWLGAFCLVGLKTLQIMKSRENLPRLPALKICGGGGGISDSGLGRAVGTRPTEADGDEDARGAVA